MNQPITIFTDGSSRGNPGPGGWAAIIAFPNDKLRELGGAEVRTTNNRMELQAVIEALDALKDFSAPAVINTDSSYVLKGATLWIKGWQRNNWITSTKSEVLNRDLWEELAKLLEEQTKRGGVSWNLVEGHVGVPANHRADEIATAFADGKPVTLYNGDRSSYSIDLTVVKGNETMKQTKDASKTRSTGKAYSYVSLVDGSVQTHKTWVECEARVKGKKAKFKKALSPEEEAEIIRSWKK
jgi:ribonuclease HI